ncbi:hypothetical protein OC835_005355 [Tilletia horrida]|uniref:Uncharacterized protein n=1 Tax=Tilletia horrida TaxID=155126 RepID=A0AAN6G579_9BASI|nr:hypothetical protein OC842_006763 [Tilletia horrida]KAK0526237.1 hypothetical protein OC835_005355 [Tilletia horrida]
MSLSNLPPEITSKIVGLVLAAATEDNPSTVVPTQPPVVMRPPSPFPLLSHTPPSGVGAAALKAAFVLAEAHPALRAGVDVHLAQEFHAFQPAYDPEVDALKAQWIPRPEARSEELRQYFQYYFGDSAPSTNDLHFQASAFDEHNAHLAQSVKVDGRVPGISAGHNHLISSLWYFQNWVASSMLVCRIGMPNPNLKCLHLRLSAHPELFSRVSHILSSNPHLVDIIIEADHPYSQDFYTRPVLRLADITSGLHHAAIERFILRTPGVELDVRDSASFTERIRRCKELGLVVFTVHHSGPAFHWAASMLQTVSQAKRIELSVAYEEEEAHYEAPAARLHCPALEHLMLDFNGIDVSFMRNIHAPNLRHLRIRTDVIANADNPCPPNHFPSLTSATVSQPGLLDPRFLALGIARSQYGHALQMRAQGADDEDCDATCNDIRPWQPVAESQRGTDEDEADGVAPHGIPTPSVALEHNLNIGTVVNNRNEAAVLFHLPSHTVRPIEELTTQDAPDALDSASKGSGARPTKRRRLSLP